ncbi:TVP38/TMEM64 family protein [Rothia sp. AR01]|uniref:TVP38/TMEM64 family membrane protein n=1 Tax=Rothia santali TaxID=2949643 RepID=A0A9X2HCR1_9MICC|nr:TVP38/TMEM64 family protein [Rothia santali]MCP3424457.1 TVP38/TMEM64 family protein [Rothia santali]
MTDDRNRPAEASRGDSSDGPRWGTVLRNALLVLVLLGMVWLALNVRLPSAEELRADLDRWGWAAWLIFIGLYAVVALTPIPVTVMAVAAGVLFGVVEGSLLSVVGVLIGCWGAYWMARGLGKQTVKRLLGRHASVVEDRLDDAGFQAVYVLRLMPGLPYWPVNYGSGAFGVSQRDFLVASVLATIPGQISLVAVGTMVAQPSVLHGIVLGASWVVVIVMTIWAYRSYKGTAKHQLPGAGLLD